MATKKSKTRPRQRRQAPKKPAGTLTTHGVLQLLAKWTDGFDERLRKIDEQGNAIFKAIEYATAKRIEKGTATVVSRINDLGAQAASHTRPATMADVVETTRSVFAPSSYADAHDDKADASRYLAGQSTPPPPVRTNFPSLVAIELVRARTKHTRAQTNPHEAFGVITEEWNEFAETVFKDMSAEAAIKELVQLAAMCQRAAEDVYKVPR